MDFPDKQITLFHQFVAVIFDIVVVDGDGWCGEIGCVHTAAVTVIRKHAKNHTK